MATYSMPRFQRACRWYVTPRLVFLTGGKELLDYIIQASQIVCCQLMLTRGWTGKVLF